MKPTELFTLETYPQPDPIILKHPVLLCHGLGALGNIIKKSLLHDVCILLRLHCITAFAPNIVPYARISVRAEAWAEIIPQILEKTKADKLHIVAHSMAGLDIRHLICNLGLTDRILSLTTVASPHRGSSLTGLTLNAPGKIRNSLIEVSNWFGNNVYPKIPSDMMGALEELSPDYIKNEFNPNHPDSEDVVYQSVSAACGKGTDHPINKLMIPFNHYVHDREGPNDGYVGEASARWGKLIETTRLSHLEQININVSGKNKGEWERLWLGIAKSLQDIEQEKNGNG